MKENTTWNKKRRNAKFFSKGQTNHLAASGIRYLIHLVTKAFVQEKRCRKGIEVHTKLIYPLLKYKWTLKRDFEQWLPACSHFKVAKSFKANLGVWPSVQTSKASQDPLIDSWWNSWKLSRDFRDAHILLIFSLCSEGKSRSYISGWLAFRLDTFCYEKNQQIYALNRRCQRALCTHDSISPETWGQDWGRKNQSSLFIPHRPFPIFVFLPWRLVFRNKKKKIKVITFRLTCGLAKSQLAKKKKKTFRECVCRMANLHDNYTGNCDSRLHSSNSLYTQC